MEAKQQMLKIQKHGLLIIEAIRQYFLLQNGINNFIRREKNFAEIQITNKIQRDASAFFFTIYQVLIGKISTSK